MANKTKPTQQRTTPRFNDVQFVNWSLDTQQKAACKAWQLDLNSLDDVLVNLIESDHKITVSYDKYRAAFTASIIPQGEKNPNAGYILTGKGSTPHKAMKQVLYIHYHIMDEHWALYSTASAIEELDD